MFNIATFLEKFRKVDTEKTLLKGTVAQILFQYGDVSIDPKELSIKNGILHIHTASPALKNQIFFKKSLIFKAFQEKLGEGVIRGIR